MNVQEVAPQQDTMQQEWQEAMRLQAESEKEAMRQEWQEALQQLENRMEEKFRQKRQEHGRPQEENREMEARVRQLEERVAHLERRESASGAQAKAASGGGRGAVAALEGRVAALEASVQRALEGVVPRVSVLVAHLEARASAEAPPVLTSSSTPSTCASVTFTPSAISAPRLPVASKPQGSSARAPPSFTDFLLRPALGEELIRAVEGGRLREVEKLLHADCDVNFARADGYTPLMAASSNGLPSVASLLLQRGADVNTSKMDGRAALHFAAANDRSGRCVQVLVAAGARADCRGVDGWTPLHCAALKGNAAAVRALLAAGASKTLKDNGGKTPLDLSCNDAVRHLLRP